MCCARAATACSKRNCAVNSWPQPVGSRDTGSASAALVANTLAYPADVLIYHAFHSSWKMTSQHHGVHSYCRRTISHAGLHSTNSSLYVTPQLRMRFGIRAFSCAGPAAWNSLPAEIRDNVDLPAYKIKLTTHFYILHIIVNFRSWFVVGLIYFVVTDSCITPVFLL